MSDDVKLAGWAPPRPACDEWRLDQRGLLDDVVVEDVVMFRMERMSDDHVWGAVYHRDGSRTDFNLHGEGLSFTHEPEVGAPPRPAPICKGCQDGLPVKDLDEDGVLTSLSGKSGKPSHAADVYWWLCTDQATREQLIEELARLQGHVPTCSQCDEVIQDNGELVCVDCAQDGIGHGAPPRPAHKEEIFATGAAEIAYDPALPDFVKCQQCHRVVGYQRAGAGMSVRDCNDCRVAPPRPATAPDLIALIQEASGLLKLLDRKGQYSSVDDWLAKAETALEALLARPVPPPLDVEEMALRRWLAGEQVNVSTGICDSLTYGYGALDNNGYWEFPLPARLCALLDEKFNLALRARPVPDMKCKDCGRIIVTPILVCPSCGFDCGGFEGRSPAVPEGAPRDPQETPDRKEL
jgi:hypothetical protein